MLISQNTKEHQKKFAGDLFDLVALHIFIFTSINTFNA